MFRVFLALIFAAALATGCSDDKTSGKTTADKGDSGTKTTSGPVVKRKKSGELCEGENCPGYIQ